MKRSLTFLLLAVMLLASGCAKKSENDEKKYEYYEGTGTPTFESVCGIEGSLQHGEEFDYFRHDCTGKDREKLVEDYVGLLEEMGYEKQDSSTATMIAMKTEKDGVLIVTDTEEYVDVLALAAGQPEVEFYPNTEVPMLENVCDVTYSDVSNKVYTMYVYSDVPSYQTVVSDYENYIKSNFGFKLTEDGTDTKVYENEKMRVGITIIRSNIYVFPMTIDQKAVGYYSNTKVPTFDSLLGIEYYNTETSNSVTHYFYKCAESEKASLISKYIGHLENDYGFVKDEEHGIENVVYVYVKGEDQAVLISGYTEGEIEVSVYER